MATSSRPRVRGEVKDLFRRLAIEHPTWGPAQLCIALDRTVRGTRGLDVNDIPSDRWVQRELKKLGSLDTSGPWSIAPDAQGRFDHDPEDVDLILSVVRALARDEWSPERRPSRAVAQWIIRIRRAYPDRELADDAALVNRLAVAASRGGELLALAEAFLTYTPWKDKASGLFEATRRGVVPPGVARTFGLAIEYATWDAIQRRKEHAR